MLEFEWWFILTKVLLQYITVVDTHQKIGLAVVVNYQADRFKQHLDI